MGTSYQCCEQLRTISNTKANLKKQNIIKECANCSPIGHVSCKVCDLRYVLLDRYVEANIPFDFVDYKIEDFAGDKKLVKLYEFLTKDIKQSFLDGQSYILKGTHGTGKTLAVSILLKKVVEKGMSGLYTTLGDMVNVLIYSDKSTKFLASRELKMVDWLVIDEFDERFMGSEVAAELFGRILESILRIRLQNSMPTFMITNQMDPTSALGEKLSASLGSLIAGYCVDVPVIGKDFRKSKKGE